jgi:hypothetical protein
MKKILFFLFLAAVFIGCTKDSTEEIKVTIMTSSDTIYNGETIKITATADKQVSKVTFYFNGNRLGSDISDPYSLSFIPENVAPGQHSIIAIAESESSGDEFTGEKEITAELRLGDFYQGGRIFYLENRVSGLIGLTKDLEYLGLTGPEVRFMWGTESLIGTTLSDGQYNTELLAANASDAGYAGFHFKKGYSNGGFSDWYIPSKSELDTLKKYKAYVGGFSNSSDWQAMYWSSSENSASMGYIINMNDVGTTTNEKTTYFKIRPIRKF